MDVGKRQTPRERRRRQTSEDILAAAWELARRDGLAAVSMRELGRMVGLRAQSLYGYFDSKAALYDAMFRQGHEEARRLQQGWPDRLADDPEPRAAFTRLTREFVGWCTEDPVRYQLLFQRTIPGWQPSEESYALAVEQLESLRMALASVDVQGDDAVDVWTAVVTGLISQQLSNDPGGQRWTRLVDRVVAMFFDHFGSSEPTDADRAREDRS